MFSRARGGNYMSSRRRRTRVAAIGLASCVALTVLSGCDFVPNHDDELAINVVNDRVLLAVCQPVAATGVKLHMREDPRSPWTMYWQASGQYDLKVGDVLASGDLAVYFQEVGVSLEPDAGESSGFDVVITSDDGGLFATFELGSADLGHGDWVHPDGDVTSEPCSP